MKMILAIINHDDANRVTRALTRAHYFVTKLATTGGFLKDGNTTLITGVEDDRVDDADSGKHQGASASAGRRRGNGLWLFHGGAQGGYGGRRNDFRAERGAV